MTVLYNAGPQLRDKVCQFHDWEGDLVGSTAIKLWPAAPSGVAHTIKIPPARPPAQDHKLVISDVKAPRHERCESVMS